MFGTFVLRDISLIHLVVMGALLLETRESLSYFIFYRLRRTGLILLEYEIFSGISDGLSDFNKLEY